jgi:hypothetical protein
MFGNIIAEVLDQRPELRTEMQPLYAASSDALERLCEKIDPDSTLVIIVDGIDHISRVFAEATGISRSDIDIVEQIALLKLPTNVRLLIGSQPGRHLDPLIPAAEFVSLPRWSRTEIGKLVARVGLASMFESAGLSEMAEDFVSRLADTSEGNPLYATFVCREIRAILLDNAVFDPTAALEAIPAHHGSLTTYYDYVIRRIEEHQAVFIAESLALIDFGVSESELKEVFPAQAHRIGGALSVLRPILTQISGQGGIRIYHESFRRYIREKVDRVGGSLSALLDPISAWLDKRGFLSDAKSYRFLLPTLRRAGQYRMLLDRITESFVSDSLAGGHPPVAIGHNLLVAAAVAADLQDWPALVRLNELQRANATYISERLGDIHTYALAMKAVLGAQVLSERLLYEGRPTYAREPGLLLCKICDDSGANPPWKEYLSLAQSSERSPISDRSLAPSWFGGVLRVQGLERGIEILADWARHFDPKHEYNSLFRLGVNEVARVFGPEGLDRLAAATGMPCWAQNEISIVQAEVSSSNGNSEAATTRASAVLANAPSLHQAAVAVSLGAPAADAATICLGLTSFDLSLADRYSISDSQAIHDWLDCLHILSRVSPQLVRQEILRVRGVGWYRLWLEFAALTALATARSMDDPNGARVEALAALRLLASDTSPFKGTPRACDLYSIHGLIHTTIADCLALLGEDVSAWRESIELLRSISNGTNTSLDYEQMGPFDSEALINAISPFVTRQSLTPVLLPAIEEELKAWRGTAGYYATLAVQHLHLAELKIRVGDSDSAKQYWDDACIFLGAYGFHKDITIFDLLESLSTIGPRSPARVAEKVQAVQPLVHSALVHSDGRETKNAVISWYDALLQARPADAIVLLINALLREGGNIDWRLEDCLRLTLKAADTTVNPIILAFLWSTADADEISRDIHSRLNVLKRLYDRYPELAPDFLRLVVSEVQGDGSKVSHSAIDAVCTFAAEQGDSTLIRDVVGPEEEQHTYPDLPARPSLQITPPPFPANATPLQLIKALRDRSINLEDEHGSIVNAFGYRLIELSETGKEADAVLLLKYFARHRFFSRGAHVLAEIAAGLESRGRTTLASLAYALAYTRSPGSGGWLVFGGEEYLDWFVKGLELDESAALNILAEEVGRQIDGSSYSLGIARHLTELFSRVGKEDLAFDVWSAAFEVINHRLPRERDRYLLFGQYDSGATTDLSTEQAAVSLLLSRLAHPEFRRKMAASAGYASSLRQFPELALPGIRSSLVQQQSLTSKLAVLAGLEQLEEQPYPVSAAVVGELADLTSSPIFGVSQLARILLSRISADSQIQPRQRAPLAPTTPTRSKAEAVLTRDRGDRATVLRKLWGELPHLVAAQFDELWNSSEADREIEKERSEIFSRTGQRKMPEPPALMWSHEMYERVLNEVLGHLDLELVRRGEINSSTLDEVARAISPHIELHSALFNSRVPRPEMPFPSEQAAGGPPQGVTDPDFAGWQRLGYFERELLLSARPGLPEYESSLTRVQGLWIGTRPARGDQNPSPIGHADSSLVFEIANSSAIRVPTSGPVVGLAIVEDFIGTLRVLSLAPALNAKLGLRRRNRIGRLELIDEQGNPAVVYRHWRVRPLGDRIGEAASRFEGCDLIARPDVYASIEGTFERFGLRTLADEHRS